MTNNVSIEEIFAVGEGERALRQARRQYDRERALGGASVQSVLSAQDVWWNAQLGLDRARNRLDQLQRD